MLVLFDVDVAEASFEVAFERLLGVGVRDINVHLVFLALIRRCLGRYYEHGDLLDELEVIGQEIVEAFQIGNLQLKPRAMTAPPLIATLSFLFLAKLLKIVLGGEVERILILVSPVQSHNVSQESELNL